MQTQEVIEQNELVLLVEQSGLEVTKQNQIAEILGVFFNKAAEWDATIRSIVITSPEETGKMKMAKEGRLTLKNMRLEAEKIVKAKRDEVKYAMANFVLEDKLWLKAGQMMEATFKNLETKLEEKETFAERWEAEQKETRKQKRIELITPYISDWQFLDLYNMTDEAFETMLGGLKLQEEAKKKAELDRIEADRLAETERQKEAEAERLRLIAIEEENKRLRIEAEEKEKDRKEAEAKAAKEKADADAKLLEAQEAQRKEREQADAKLKALEAEKQRLEADAKAKKEAEDKAEKDRKEAELAEAKTKQEAEKKAAKAPDKEKLKVFVNSAILMDMKLELSSEESIRLKADIQAKFDGFKQWALNQVNQL